MGTSFYTTSVSQFRYIPGNRPIKWRKVAALAKEILRKNKLKDWPIKVLVNTTDVVDGQHRVEAVKKLRAEGHDIGIYFEFTNETIDEMAMSNMQVTRWNAMDWLNYCSQSDNYPDDYKTIKQFIDANPKMSLTSVLTIASGVNSKYRKVILENFYSGTYKIADMDKLQQVARISGIARSNGLRTAGDFRFLVAISIIADLENFSESRLVANLDRASEILSPKLTIDGYARMLVAIHNHMARSGKRIYLAEQYR